MKIDLTRMTQTVTGERVGQAQMPLLILYSTIYIPIYECFAGQVYLCHFEKDRLHYWYHTHTVHAKIV